jgi:mannose-6-phosphate isomerase-like protein (cupin superfamily)
MSEQRAPIVLAPGDGRRYDMGPIRATFLADRRDTVTAYSISTWRLEAHTTGPGAHSHPEDDVFLVTEGTMSFLVDGAWREAPTGTFVLVPGGAIHDFENRGEVPATVFNISVPGEFEEHMPGIVAWFREHPPTRTSW